MKIIEIQFDMQNNEIVAYDGDLIKRFEGSLSENVKPVVA